jgi:hypothetical protein
MARRLAAAILCFTALSAAAGPSEDAFEKLKALSGDWEAKTPKGGTLHVSYRLVSRESVLVETWAPGTKSETITVFHLDGPSLLATHYCAQGNQPRLALASSGPDGYVFEFRDATNLAKPAASHLRRLRVALSDADHFTKEETYVEAGKDDASALSFTRVK